MFRLSLQKVHKAVTGRTAKKCWWLVKHTLGVGVVVTGLMLSTEFREVYSELQGVAEVEIPVAPVAPVIPAPEETVVLEPESMELEGASMPETVLVSQDVTCTKGETCE